MRFDASNVHSSSFAVPGRYNFEPPMQCYVRDRRGCEQLCRRTSSCLSWSWQCDGGRSCCMYSTPNPISRDNLGCGWAGSVLVQNQSSCTKLLVAPRGYVITLELQPRERLNIAVAVYDDHAIASSQLYPVSGRLFRSSGRRLRLVLGEAPQRPHPAGCTQENAWRAKITLEEEQFTPTVAMPSMKTSPSNDIFGHALPWTTLLAIILAAMSTLCCAAAWYLQLSSLQMAIFVGGPAFPRQVEQRQLPARGEGTTSSVELAFGDVVRQDNSGTLESTDNLTLAVPLNWHSLHLL